MVTCHSSVPLVTSRLQSHRLGSTEKTSKGSALPSPGMQHKGLLHTASCVATTRKPLNMTILQFHSALGCSPLLEKTDSYCKFSNIPFLQWQASQIQFRIPHGSKYLHFRHPSENYLHTTDLNDGYMSPRIKQQYFDLSSAVPREHQEGHRRKMQLLKRCREMGYTAQQWTKWTKTHLSLMLA